MIPCPAFIVNTTHLLPLFPPHNLSCSVLIFSHPANFHPQIAFLQGDVVIHSMGNCGGNAATGFAVVQVCGLLRVLFRWCKSARIQFKFTRVGILGIFFSSA